MTRFNFERHAAHLLRAATMAAGFATFATASAQTYPEKPITLYVGFAPGGAADSVARVVSEEMSK